MLKVEEVKIEVKVGISSKSGSLSSSASCHNDKDSRYGVKIYISGYVYYIFYGRFIVLKLMNYPMLVTLININVEDRKRPIY